MTTGTAPTPIDAPKRRGRHSKLMDISHTIETWFTRPAKNHDTSRGGLKQVRRTSIYGHPLTIDAFNTHLASWQEFDILNQTLMTQYSPFVLSVVSAFSAAARGLPKADKQTKRSNNRLAMIAAIREPIDGPASPITPHISNKLKLAGITHYGLLAGLSPEDRLTCIDLHHSHTNRRSDMHSALSRKGLLIFEGGWFNVRSALWHRRTTINAQEADYYGPEKIIADLVHIAETCDGQGLRHICHTTPRLAAIATQNAMRIAYYEHSCIRRLTLTHGKRADIEGCIQIGQTGDLIKGAFTDAGTMNARTIKHIERLVAARVAEFERDHARVVWQPTR